MSNEKLSKLRALVERWQSQGTSLGPFPSLGIQHADELSAILEQPEEKAEPVAWMRVTEKYKFFYADPREIAFQLIPLYTAPPELESLRAENARLAAELAKAREDAERYRWLRDGETDFATDDFPVARMSAEDRALWGEELDEAVDAAKGEKT